MAADYPGSLYTAVDKTDKSDLVAADDMNGVQDEIEAIEAELGTDVAGSATDLKTRLAITIADNGGIKSGTSFPGSPVDYQFFYRTDLSTLYHYDSGWNAIASLPDYASGNYVDASAPSEVSNNDTSYAKAKELTPVVRAGTIKVAFDLKRDGNTCYGKIYKNGSPVGTERSNTSSSYVEYTEDITVAVGDVISIYCKISDGGSNYFVKDLEIRTDAPTQPTEVS